MDNQQETNKILIKKQNLKKKLRTTYLTKLTPFKYKFLKNLINIIYNNKL